MAQKSNLDVAYEVVKGSTTPVPFIELWNEVASIQGFNQSDKSGKIGKFYTNLLLDGRFVNLGNNTWDLRERNKFETVHINMSDCYDEVDEEEYDPEELAEEKQEEKALGGDVEEDDDENASKYEPEEQA